MKALNTFAAVAIAATTLLAATSASATGLATCDSGAKSTWQPQATLEKQLKDKG